MSDADILQISLYKFLTKQKDPLYKLYKLMYY